MAKSDASQSNRWRYMNECTLPTEKSTSRWGRSVRAEENEATGPDMQRKLKFDAQQDVQCAALNAIRKQDTAKLVSRKRKMWREKKTRPFTKKRTTFDSIYGLWISTGPFKCNAIINLLPFNEWDGSHSYSFNGKWAYVIFCERAK